MDGSGECEWAWLLTGKGLYRVTKNRAMNHVEHPAAVRGQKNHS